MRKGLLIAGASLAVLCAAFVAVDWEQWIPKPRGVTDIAETSMDLKFLLGQVRSYAETEGKGVVPEFDSRYVGAVSAWIGRKRSEDRKFLEATSSRDWSYRTSASSVGHRIDDLSADTILIETVPGRRSALIKGMTVVGGGVFPNKL